MGVQYNLRKQKIGDPFIMEDLNTIKHQHKMSINNRKDCSISGVVDVLSFDVNEILLETEQGMLMIRGSALHVTRLTLEKGEIEIDGKIDSLTYSEHGPHSHGENSFLAKLFK